jgi:hypothetical protein
MSTQEHTAPPADLRRNGKTNWPVTLGVIGIVFVTTWIMAVNSTSTSSTTATTQSAPTSDSVPAEVGDTRIIASDNLPCASTVDNFNVFTKAAVANDTQGMTDSLSTGVSLTAGTKVRMIAQSGFMPPLIQLRILTGPDQGRSCWTDESIQGLFR